MPETGMEKVVGEAHHPIVEPRGNPANLVASDQALPGSFIMIVADFGADVFVEATGKCFPFGAVVLPEKADLYHEVNPAMNPIGPQ
jgi:hypothetical protein